MADDAKLCSPIHSTFEAFIVWPVVMHCHGEELGPFCWPMLAQALQFLVHFIDLLSILLRCNGFAGIQKAVVDEMGNRPPVTITPFLVKFGFGKCFGASSQCSHWAAHHWLSCKIHFSLYVTIQERNGSLLCRVRDDDTSKRQFCWFSVNPWGTYFSDFFTFPICFKCHVIVDWTTIFFSIKI